MNNEQLIKFCQEQAITADHDFQDTVFVAITRRDVWLLCFATMTVAGGEPLVEYATDLRTRIAEIVEVQKDGWRSAI